MAVRRFALRLLAADFLWAEAWNAAAAGQIQLFDRAWGVSQAVSGTHDSLEMGTSKLLLWFRKKAGWWDIRRLFAAGFAQNFIY